MAETNTDGYKGSGFDQSSGVKDLNKAASDIKTYPKAYDKEAREQYKPTYDLEQQSLTNQLSALIKSQSNDSELLNKSYQQSVNTMMSKLQQRGLNAGSLPGTTEAALHKFHNEVMDERAVFYGVQRQGIENRQKALKENYELNVAARASQIKLYNLKTKTDLLTKIADIQANSYQNYINYLLAEQQQKAARSGGGGRRYYGGYGGRYYGYGRGGSGGSGGSGGGPDAQPSGSLNPSYFDKPTSGATGPGIANTLVNMIKGAVKGGGKVMGGIANYVTKHRK